MARRSVGRQLIRSLAYYKAKGDRRGFRQAAGGGSLPGMRATTRSWQPVPRGGRRTRMPCEGDIVNAPDGWVFEPADPSVGIMASGCWHEDCPKWPADGNQQEAEETREYLPAIGEGANRFTPSRITLRCPACGAEYSWIENEWDPDITEDEL